MRDFAGCSDAFSHGHCDIGINSCDIGYSGIDFFPHFMSFAHVWEIIGKHCKADEKHKAGAKAFIIWRANVDSRHWEDKTSQSFNFSCELPSILWKTMKKSEHG